ncbi:Propionyl-CoA carboxylase alpha subunit protein [Candidatus Micropelagos thuwalensis]|uniref:Pseudouridine synthase n=1 Tax=Candidatus Micropelagius thuwalensis TaxID=1397666 RepID=U2WC49_9PROT|nr:RluA family pseudouridine synthase [Candidatus Micropelagos thuwalensis]ERL47134.1 Propionyl-CoA carboxylase alpha subunit protein [Candidatus Micropelagos thuwalensis]
MSGVQHLQVQPDQAGMRLDRWFRSLFPHISHIQLEKLLRKGQIRVDGGRAKSSLRLEAWQMIRVPPLVTPDQSKQRAKQEKRAVPLHLQDMILKSIIYEDADVIALNKPSGLAVQGGSKTDWHVDALLDVLADKGERPRLVHRLDRDTSGVLLLAKHRKAASALTKAFAERETRKIYWALVHGVPRPEQGDIKLKLVKRAAGDGNERVRPAEDHDKEAMKAITRFSVVSRAGQVFSWVAFMPITGRTHQIRAHALAIGHPLVGDNKYTLPEIETGGELPNKLHLHARMIDMPHPSGGRLIVAADLQAHMAESWGLLGFESNDYEDPFPREAS